MANRTHGRRHLNALLAPRSAFVGCVLLSLLVSLPLGCKEGNDPPRDAGPEDTNPPGDADLSDTDPVCRPITVTPGYLPPNVMLLVDASASMDTSLWDHDLDSGTPDETHWKTLHRVLAMVMDELGPGLRAGVKRFPSAHASPHYVAAACALTPDPEVVLAVDHGEAILAAIPGPDDDVYGARPVTAAFESVASHLAEQPAHIPRHVFLMTNGAANCAAGLDFPDILEYYDENLVPAVQNARENEDVTTFVIGIEIVDALLNAGPDGLPEANPHERLNDVAIAGGAPRDGAQKYHNATSQAELLDALAGIVDDITECIVDLSTTDEGVPDPSRIPYVSFEADGEMVPKVDDCEAEDGWTWLEEGTLMTFCGSLCQNFKKRSAVFGGTYGCPPAT
jgi:hypothetical protein